MQRGKTWKRDQKITTAGQQTFDPLDTTLLSFEGGQVTVTSTQRLTVSPWW